MTDVEAQAGIYYDPYSYEIDLDPHPTWRRMRDEAPVYYNDELDFYALSQYADVLSASIDVETFSSAHGTMLSMMAMDPGKMIGGSVLFIDPPTHDVLRRLVSRGFTPRRVGLLQETIRGFTRGLLDDVRDLESFDYVDAVAGKLPPMVIGAYLGLPTEEADLRRRMTDESLHIEEGETGAGGSPNMSVAIDYYLGHIRERTARPQDDMITDLCQAEATFDGETRRLTEEEILDFVIMMSSAGNETVARALAWSAIYLSRLPGQRQKLLDDPSRCGNAFEELLRYEAPSPVQGRWTTRDVEYHATTIPANSKVLLLTGSATRDDRQFTDPDVFDVTRKMEGQIAFGHGIHFCLGAALAREEGHIALEETLKVMPSWEVEEVDMVHTAAVRGPSRVVVHRT
jgi:cytochrome P450